MRPQDPGRVLDGPTFAVALSGGGFRAMLSALGVLRFLADAGLLRDVRFVSSASGGSVTNGMLATRWTRLRERGFSTPALDELVVGPLVDSVAGSSLKWELVRHAWRTAGPATRTELLAEALDRRFFAGALLEDLDPACRYIINAANLGTGVRFAFERDVVGDYVLGLAPTAGTGLRVATAVAASAAVPGTFPPLRLPGIAFPCADARRTPILADGGAYDNTGLEALDKDRYQDVFLVALNAGGIFIPGPLDRVPVAGELKRANSLLYRQSTALRTRWMVERFHSWNDLSAGGRPSSARRGVLFGLAAEMRSPAADRWRRRFPEHRSWNGRDLALFPTVFDRLDSRLCRLLIYRGWWLTGAAFATFHPELADLAAIEDSPPL
ncbi:MULTISPECIES: patatin-like phospholipase family protein [Pseudofrankia]|uniref:patatin-like phospholipase family protein n=1 Tax=Pseudofrankia TaxID=2994363 RepID=UPI0002F55D7E|nr:MULTISPECIES: patatin-like phospholipase family protein [Pseudofrankia]